MSRRSNGFGSENLGGRRRVPSKDRRRRTARPGSWFVSNSSRVELAPIVERLEDRTLLAVTVYGVTEPSGNSQNLIVFDSAAPGTIIRTTTLTGYNVAVREIEAIDFRRLDGSLFALVVDSATNANGKHDASLFIIVTATATAEKFADLTAASGDAYTGLSGSDFGIDFDDSTSNLRIVSDADENLTVVLSTSGGNSAAVTTGASISPAAAVVSSIAFSAAPALFGIDSDADDLVTIASDGTTTSVGDLGVGFSPASGLDIHELTATTRIAFASRRTGNEAEFYSINLTSGAATRVGTTIGNNLRVADIALHATVSLSRSPAAGSISEDNGTFSVVATLTETSRDDVFVPLSFSGTATEPGNPGADYSRSGTSITIPAGMTSGSITITSTPDNLDEPDETIIVTISGTTSAVIEGNSSVTATISDLDPPPTVTLSPATGMFSETSNGTGTFDITVSLSAASGKIVTVPLTLSGTATEDTDYTTTSKMLEFMPGDSPKTFRITDVLDSLSEGPETIIVSINTGGLINATPGTTTQSTITLNDDEGVPTVTLSADSMTLEESNNGQLRKVTFTATLSGTSTSPTAVNLSYGGTTTRGPSGDYQGPLSVTIPANDTFATFDVTEVRDSIDEDDETIVVSIASVSSNATIGSTSSVTVTLTDDDPAPFARLSRSPASINETSGPGGSLATATITATLVDSGGNSITSAKPITVNLAFAGSADLTEDYTASGSVIMIPAGTGSGSITLTEVRDAIDEDDEMINVSISSTPVNAQVGNPSTVMVTIVDNDPAPVVTLSSSSPTFVEGGTLTVSVNLSAVSEKSFTVNLRFDGGVSPQGYVASATAVSFPAGTNMQTVTLTATDDSVVEGDQAVVVMIFSVSPGGNGTIGNPSTLNLTLQDNDVAGSIRFAQANYNANEDTTGTLNVRILREGGDASGVMVTYTASDVTATSTVLSPADPTRPTDYSVAGGLTGTITFNQGEVFRDVSITIFNDNRVESSIETFRLTLSNPTSNAVLTPGLDVTTVSINEDDTFTVSNPGDYGAAAPVIKGTLRRVIELSNDPANPELNTIEFALARNLDGSLPRIQPIRPLPTLTDPAVIDGNTQKQLAPANSSDPDPITVLDGSTAGVGTSGLIIDRPPSAASGVSRILGLVIQNFDGNGVVIRGLSQAVIRGSFIGADSTGQAAAGNGGWGIVVDGASGNTIGANNNVVANDGSVSVLRGNLISGNGQGGIVLRANAGMTPTNNVIQGNLIGTGLDQTNVPTLENDGPGVFVSSASNTVIGAPANILGTPSLVLGNIIAFNGGFGVAVGDQSAMPQTFRNTRTTIRANRIFENDNDAIFVEGDKPSAAVIPGAVFTGSTSIVQVPYSGPQNANQTFIFDFYLNRDQLAKAGGKRFIPSGSRTLTADANGNYSLRDFDLLTGGENLLRQFAAVTVTDSSGNTSEFSNQRQIRALFEVTNLLDSGTGSLRAVITAANATPERDSVSFLIPVEQAVGGVFTIALASALPSVTSPIVIDGLTQPIANGANPTAPVLTVSGSGIPASSVNAGLRITGGNSEIRGLAFDGFASGVGIELIGSGQNFINGNYVGLTPADQSSVRMNAGVSIVASSNNTIGGGAPSARNVISGNKTGVSVSGQSANNIIIGNYIGTRIAGGSALGNEVGVLIDGANTSGNVVGRPNAGEGNVVSGNAEQGVLIRNSASGNLIQANTIGAAVDDVSLGNGLDGIAIVASTNNTVGGGANVGSSGVGAGNVIVDNGGAGVRIGSGSSGNLLVGNLIGLKFDGSAAGNVEDGVLVEGANSNTIGGNAGNTISGNAGAGVRIRREATNSPSVNSAGNGVFGNFIGVSKDGSAALANGGAGVALEDVSGNTVGGSNLPARNLISGNMLSGVVLSGVQTTSNLIRGNVIGLDALGTLAIPNGVDGVEIASAFANTIGGLNRDTANVISGNSRHGVSVVVSASQSMANLIASNVIGLDVNGNVDRDAPQRLGNKMDGILVTQPAQAPTGIRSVLISSNVIAGSAGFGVRILTSGNAVVVGAPGPLIETNLIGTDRNGAVAAGNTSGGVSISHSTNVRIESNVIAGNGAAGASAQGISVVASDAIRILDNLIGTNDAGASDLGNSGDGLRLDGVKNATVGDLGQGNTVSSNKGRGIYILGADSSGAILSSNRVGVSPFAPGRLGNALEGILVETAANVLIDSNVVSSNADAGVRIKSAPGATISGNFIGTDSDGLSILGNTKQGLLVEDSPNLRIGDIAEANSGNVVSNNGGSGVEVRGTTSIGIRVESNIVGSDTTGSADRGNEGSGILIKDAPAVILESNLVSSNRMHGIEASGDAARGLMVSGNIIGSNRAGTADRGNARDGVNLFGIENARLISNVVASNKNYGVQLLNATGAKLIGNFVGTAASLANLGNAFSGIRVVDSANPTIGGTTLGEGNTVVNNRMHGVEVVGAGSTGLQILGNFIGTDALATTDLGNALDGVRLAPNGSGVGPAGAVVRANVVAANKAVGIDILNSANATISGNLVGTGASFANLGNASVGIRGTDAPGLKIGEVGAGNVIAFNLGAGIEVLGSGSTGLSIISNVVGTDFAGGTEGGNGGDGIRIAPTSNGAGPGGAVIRSNVSASNRANAISLERSNDILIVGNTIGSTALERDFGNARDGLFISDSSRVVVGGITSVDTNIIVNNRRNGINLTNSPDAVVVGNLIGVYRSGTGRPGNFSDGLRAEDSSGLRIGGDVVEAGNVVANNRLHGVEILGASSSGALIKKNRIGGAERGNAFDGVRVEAPKSAAAPSMNFRALENEIGGNSGRGIEIVGGKGYVIGGNTIGGAAGNGQEGIRVDNAADVIIGDATPNIVSMNGEHGVQIVGLLSTAAIVTNNIIGLDAAGGTVRGNTLDGVRVEFAPGVLVRNNVLSGNGGHGVELIGSNGSQVAANFIGTNRGTMPSLGNKQTGVRVENSNDVSIGGTSSTDGNVIAGNLSHGVEILGGAGFKIQGNQIGFTESLTNGGNGILITNAAAGFIGDDSDPSGASSATIEGNVIRSNALNGIQIVNGDGNLIQRNKIAGQRGQGVQLSNESSENRIVANTIGGLSSAEENLGIGVSTRNSDANTIGGNLIGFNRGDGVFLFQSMRAEVNGNIVRDNSGAGIALDDSSNNTIGVAGLGNQITSNKSQGIRITGNESSGNIVAGNSSTRNLLDGVLVSQSTRGNVIQGNTVGGNRSHGIQISDSANVKVEENAIGSVTNRNSGNGLFITESSANTITGNTIGSSGLNGVFTSGDGSFGNRFERNSIIDSSVDGAVFDRAPRNTFGGSGDRGNTVTRSGAGGVVIIGAAGNVVSSNAIAESRLRGVVVNGAEARGNIVTSNTISNSVFDGISIDQASFNTIASNTIDFSGFDGIVLNQASDNLVGGAGGRNTVRGSKGNGVSVSGVNANRNEILNNLIEKSGVDGIIVNLGSRNVIGRAGVGLGNVIISSGGNGISIVGASAIKNSIAANRIGLDDLDADRGNANDGVFISEGTENSIGGETAASRNVISGNDRAGIQIEKSSNAKNRIDGNFIGTDATGSRAIGNGVGILIRNSSGNTIGGEARNVVSGNLGVGILIDGESPSNEILRNYIGLAATGLTGVGNDTGIFLNNVAKTKVDGNFISFNQLYGVFVFGDSSSGTTISGNVVGFPDGSHGDFVRDPNAFAAAGRQDQGVVLSATRENRLEKNTIGGNIVGLTITGNVADSNHAIISNELTRNLIGIRVVDSAGNVIGAPNAANTISDNVGIGISLEGTLTTRNKIRSNRIVNNFGLNKQTERQTRSVLRGSNNVGIGIYIRRAVGNTIGTEAATRNTRVGDDPAANEIAGNAVSEIYMFDGATRNAVRGNKIGGPNTPTSNYGVFLFNTVGNIADVVRRGPGSNLFRPVFLAKFRAFLTNRRAPGFLFDIPRDLSSLPPDQAEAARQAAAVIPAASATARKTPSGPIAAMRQSKSRS